MMDYFDELRTLFEGAQKFAISTHINPDGDAIGSELALYFFLKELGKTVRIFNTDKVPKKYQFLPNWEKIEDAQSCVGYTTEVFIVLDASSRDRIGSFLSKNLIPTKAVVNIDHHATAEEFGDYNIIVPDASSTAEIIYNFIKYTSQPIDVLTAICLYTGVMFDTGCFRFSNSSPETHKIAAELIEIGEFAPDDIYRHVFEKVSLEKINLLSHTLRTLEMTPDGKIAWIKVTQVLLQKTNTTLDDLEGFVNQIQAIDTVEVAMCFCELPEGNTKVSLRSEGRVNVGALASDFNGGGHERASGCLINRPIHASIKLLISKAKRYIRDN